MSILSTSSGHDGAPTASRADTLTPAMRQYVEQKSRVGDAVLLFRMGDFYETFYDDAVLCSKVLGIALTARSKGDNPIPLAGIPFHALDGYLRKLVAAGYRVAISEQMEDPKQAKGVVRRDVVRIVTAGTLTEDTILSGRDDNLLASFCIRGQAAGLAWIDLAGGRFEVTDVPSEGALDELVRLRPAELLLDDERGGPTENLAQQLKELAGTALTRRPELDFGSYQARKALLDHFQVGTLSGFGFDDMTHSLCAAGAILHYLHETQKAALPHVVSIRRREIGEFLRIDHSSFRALEIERTLRAGTREGSLVHAVDRTVHPMGTRRLKQWLCAPLTQVSQILSRQDAVGTFIEDPPLRREIRERLKAMADVERIVARVALNRASPRDLAGLARSLALLPGVAGQLAGRFLELSKPFSTVDGPTRSATLADPAPQLPSETPGTLASSTGFRTSTVSTGELHPGGFVAQIAADLSGLENLALLLRQAIREDPPHSLREGGFIADGFDPELDRLRSIGHDGRSWLAEFQKREIERTGLSTLRVGFNRVFGYYIELPHTAAEKVPPDYVRRQTIKNSERYVTEELKKYEEEVLTAQGRAHDLEYRLFERLRERVTLDIPLLTRVGDAIGRLDCVAALAELAVERRYVRPMPVDDSRLEIHDGRHPVLEQILADRFVPNDTIMSAEDARVLVITGPNMAGKSTFIRQTALITLLAQTGSYVPAHKMSWSIVDRIFARVGSSDELMRGQSTFMVEMTEAANILHNGTRRSLVILDELGRGTSTFDGLSLAWAITEHLATQLRCRTLVATHYHELTELAQLLHGVRNYNVAVCEYPEVRNQTEGVVFLHRIVEGGASKSYGIHVAALAGIPRPVVERSREILEELERSFVRESKTPQFSRKKSRADSQLPLFGEQC